jgi:hypothetical protein
LALVRLLLILWVSAWSVPVYAQPIVQIVSRSNTDTLSSNGDSFVVPVGGMASARFQTLDTYSGTWEVQGSVDGGVTYDADDELNLTLEGASSAAVQSVTDTVGIWTASVAGYTHIRVIATAGFAASDTVIAVVAVVSGGNPGSSNSSVTAVGTLTNDNAAATSNRIATLPVITETSAPTRTNGRDAALSGTAGGSIRVMIADAAGAAVTVATDATLGTSTYTEATSTGPIGGNVRNDTLDALANTTNEIAPNASTAQGALWTASSATTNGGCTVGSSISSGAVLETEIKATAGQLYYIVITAIDATPVFARLYNLTAANASEASTPVQRFAVPSSATAAGFALPIAVGAEFSTAITLRVTTGAADNDTGALSANEVFVSYCYK